MKVCPAWKVQRSRKSHVSGQAPSRAQNQGQSPRPRPVPPGAVVQGELRLAHTHTLPSFSLKQGKNGKAGLVEVGGSISSSFPFEILAAEPGGPKYMARSTGCPLQHFAVLEGLTPVGLRVGSHLPRHDCPVNQLEPSLTRQKSVELIAHQTVRMVISVS